MKKHPRISN